MSAFELKLEIELGSIPREFQRWATVKLSGMPIFTELVYDTPETPAEHNIKLVFGEKLKKLLEDA